MAPFRDEQHLAAAAYVALIAAEQRRGQRKRLSRPREISRPASVASVASEVGESFAHVPASHALDDETGTTVFALVEGDHDALVPALKDQQFVANAADNVETVGDHRRKDVLNGLAKRCLAP
jgi:hypothetical protein